MPELSLPERLVHAAEMAIDEARICGVKGLNGTTVEGHLTDFAKAAADAVIEVLASDMEANDGAGHAVLLRLLAQAVRDVPALKEV